LVSKGLSVLLSTATDHPLKLVDHPLIQRRCGALDELALYRLLKQRSIEAIVDATHPYAEVIGPLSSLAAQKYRIPYFRFIRPSGINSNRSIILATDHEDAAGRAFFLGCPVLLTIGSKNLEPYVNVANKSGTLFYVRILNRGASILACMSLGIGVSQIIAEQGPFSLLDNIALIRRLKIGVLVTKDSGRAGGVPEKILAAEKTNCRVVMVQRPAIQTAAFSTATELLSAVASAVVCSK
jgi:precorrin-6A/cobalt-precorrin-6A reductase